jgi:DHA1 family tetracycline resistance protein-like MFS transporter
MARKHRLALFPILFLIVTLNMMSIGIILPVLPDLILSIAPVSNAESAKLGSLLLLSFAFAQFLFAPLLGSLSDRFGRRPILLGGLFGVALDFLILALAPSLLILIFARFIGGIFGSTYPTVNAIIADTTPPEARPARYGIISAAWGTGMIMGPIAGGFLGEYGARMPFFAAALAIAMAFLLAVFLLPETLKPANRQPFQILKSNPLGAIFDMVRFPGLPQALFALLCMLTASQAILSTFPFFVRQVFGWSSGMTGLAFGFYAIGTIVVQITLVRVLSQRLGLAKSITLGFAAQCLSYCIFAITEQPALAFACMAIGAIGGICFPLIQSLTTGLVDEASQGRLQGAISSAASLSALFGVFLMPQVYAKFSDGEGLYFPGAPFLLGAVLTVVAMASIQSVRKPPSTN